MYYIDRSICRGCAGCVECFVDAIVPSLDVGIETVFYTINDSCAHCGMCVSLCPFGAIVDSEGPEHDASQQRQKEFKDECQQRFKEVTNNYQTFVYQPDRGSSETAMQYANRKMSEWGFPFEMYIQSSSAVRQGMWDSGCEQAFRERSDWFDNFTKVQDFGVHVHFILFKF